IGSIDEEELVTSNEDEEDEEDNLPDPVRVDGACARYQEQSERLQQVFNRYELIRSELKDRNLRLKSDLEAIQAMDEEVTFPDNFLEKESSLKKEIEQLEGQQVKASD
ncbi:MAG: hypothetical protein ABEJ24_03305, partial [Candidatus Magasanikbacteria bacterium]